MTSQNRIAHLDQNNLELLDLRDQFKLGIRDNPELIFPWYFPCDVRTLIVTDGGLDFSLDNFGLATFVKTLLDTAGPARLKITLGHIENRSGPAMMDFDERIVARIPNFKFDDMAHFAADRYDVVFLFGIRTGGVVRTGTMANGEDYPLDSLAETELQEIAEFQNGGGGVFATGDHGALGKFLGANLPRGRNMRIWESTSSNVDLDQVSMGGRLRNDTNRLGDAGSQFDDQSDDVPQTIRLKMYSVSNRIFEYSYPHPLLCGPDGPIRVMPDHPHEGECITPEDPDLILRFTDDLGPEYPPAIDGGPRPLPEVISTNTVLSGTVSGKTATVGHNFGGICAYDGHRAGVGRVVTDATWHHFVNINLIGDRTPSTPAKGLGFLASASGEAHLENIRAYYRNLAIWLSRRSNIRCLNSGLVVKMLHADRIMEAVLTTNAVTLEEVHPATLSLIGQHARNVLGQFYSQCQHRRLILDLVFPEFEPLLPEINPWWGAFSDAELRDRDFVLPERIDGDINWVNADQILNVALGAALVRVNEQQNTREKMDAETVEKLATEGGQLGFELARKSLGEALEDVRQSFLR